MLPVPTEDELKQYLANISEYNYLPHWAELEPGSFFYVVKLIWEREQDRDGRRGHISESKIAEEISKLLGRKFTRNQYQSMFGSGRKDQKSKTVIPKDIAEAFLIVAFQNWSFGHTDQTETSGFKNIFQGLNTNLEDLAKQICNLVYSYDSEVRCVPSPGLGPRGFYRECRKNNRSVILAAEREHIVMDSPGSGFTNWLGHILLYFRDIEKNNAPLMHVWVFREPLISLNSKQIYSFHDIGKLRTAFFIARGMCMSQKPRYPTWEKLSQRCIVVMFLNRNNDKFRKEKKQPFKNYDNPILEDLIFLNELPWDWVSQGENGNSTDLKFATTIKENEQRELDIDYYKIIGENCEIPPIIKKNTPGVDTDQSFKNLYKSCRHYIDYKANGTQTDLLAAAVQHRWSFMTADEFLDLRIP